MKIAASASSLYGWAKRPLQDGNVVQLGGCTGYSLPTKLYRLSFSAHAKTRMKERGISVEDVVEALEAPAQLVYDRMRDVYLILGNNGVAVVYAVRGLIVEIVTVMRRREYEALLGRLGSKRYRVLC